LNTAEGTPFLPDDRPGKAQALRWMFFEQYSHEPNIAVARAWLHVFDTEMTEEHRGALEVKQKLGYDSLGVMEKHLGGRIFFVGGRYSVADIALYAYTHVADEGGFDLQDFPAVRAWLERVSSQPGYIPITQG
jgi:glutathione S-transferase